MDDVTATLQRLLDDSFARSSEHLRSIMTPERRLSAERLLAELPCPAVLNIATVTARGEPRVSAVDGHFLDGSWYFTTSAESPKARQLAARPAISASFTPRDGYGVFCHGRAALLEAPDRERDSLFRHFADVYGQSPEEWGTEIYAARIDADWLVGFAMTPAEEVEIARAAAERAQRRGGAAGAPCGTMTGP
jgi:nitroimidazol reductase NimA-like FMN-containing flavoprotein (pyridoxamine 5'-phosphate oxidase superfamily)